MLSPGTLHVAVVSDIHFAGERERTRAGHESRAIANPVLRLALGAWRRWVWLRDPFAHNGLLDAVIDRVRTADLVVANGDFSCDTAFIGVADDASFDSAQQCLDRLRHAFQGRLKLTVGDHELGKKSFFGGVGGMRLESWPRTIESLRIEPAWSHRLGGCHLIGVTSTLWALPVFASDALASEMNAWQSLRADHVSQVERMVSALGEGDRWILFCHDPTALPFLAKSEAIVRRLPQLECTIIGHLHSELIYWKSRCLAGMPTITFLGHSIRRMSRALQMSKIWPHFRVRLCPSLAGLEIRKDGGYLMLEVHPDGDHPVRITRMLLPRVSQGGK